MVLPAFMWIQEIAQDYVISVSGALPVRARGVIIDNAQDFFLEV